MQNFRKHWLLLLWLLAVALGGAFSGVESGEACPFMQASGNPSSTSCFYDSACPNSLCHVSQCSGQGCGSGVAAACGLTFSCVDACNSRCS